MKVFGQVVLCVVVIVFLIGVGLATRYSSIYIEGFFQPLEQDIQRGVFENTKSFNEGKEQELVKYRLEYMRGDENDKAAISAAVRHSFADYDTSRLSPELADFVNQCKGEF